MSPVRPDLRHERGLLRSGARVVAGMDEVGRGALAGPVSVGVVAVDLTTRACPQGVADSKLLSPAARERLLPALGRWGLARAVGHASAQEIDALGIIAALRLAGTRALAALDVEVDLVLLDGSHDWLTTPAIPAAPVVQDGLFDLDLDLGLPRPGGSFAAVAHGMPLVGVPSLVVPKVRTKVKADRVCASVAAASVLAKCERDAAMVVHSDRFPEFRWHENKGYGSPEHIAALRLLGPTEMHRRSWRLPTSDDDPTGGTERAPSEVDPEPEPGARAGEAAVSEVDARRWSMMDA